MPSTSAGDSAVLGYEVHTAMPEIHAAFGSKCEHIARIFFQSSLTAFQ
jgi:hypothetical protein